jgi:hypothetical protein
LFVKHEVLEIRVDERRLRMQVLNAFSPNMLSAFPAEVQFREIPLNEAQAITAVGIESAVGHADTATVFGEQLGCSVPANRATVSLKKGDVVLVGQYRGPRLPEGATTLPAGATIQWLLVSVL